MATRDRKDEPLIGVRAKPSFTSAVESAAATRGLSKSALTRRALASYLLSSSRTGAKK